MLNIPFDLWTVENPMTVLMSPAPKRRFTGIWGFITDGKTLRSEFDYSESSIYTVWDYKTMNLNTIKITLSLN